MTSAGKEDNTTPETSDFIDQEIQDIDDTGPTTAKKLKEASIVSVLNLAVTAASVVRDL